MSRLRLKGKYLGSSPTFDTTDLGDWTTPVPVAHSGGTLTAVAETGSRIYYVDPTAGVDSTTLTVASYYLWDGTNIVDSTGSATGAGGVPYGTDPFNPTGPIKPFQHWSYVAPARNPGGGEVYGLANTDRGAVRYNSGAGRVGKPDWWLFKRGEVIDLTTDLAVMSTIAGNGLNIPGGADSSNVQVVGAYGATTDARPRFTHPSTNFISRQPNADVQFKHARYLSLHIDARDRTSGSGFDTVPGRFNEFDNVIFEDVYFDGTPVDIQSCTSPALCTLGLKFRRCILADAYRTTASNTEGIYTANYESFVFQEEECISYRGGSRNTAAPGLTDAFDPPTFDIRDRNNYASGLINGTYSHVDDSVYLVGGSGEQWRCQMSLRRNFFVAGYVSTGSQSALDSSSYGALSNDNCLLVEDNVMQVFKNGSAHPGSGMGLSGMVRGATMQRNIVTAAQLIEDAQEMAGGVFGIGYISAGQNQLANRTLTSNTITNNVGYGTSTAHPAFGADDGVNVGSAPVSCTITPGTPISIGQVAHGRVANSLVSFRTTGTLPGALTPAVPGDNGASPAQVYYVRNPTANAFEISTTSGGASINNATAGSGTHTVTDPSSASYAYPGVTGNTISANVCVGAAGGGGAFGTYDTTGRYLGTTGSDLNTYTSNRRYDTPAAAKSAEGWIAPERTFKTYMQAIGFTLAAPSVTGFDGIGEYITAARNFRRGQWPRWARAKNIVNYIRYGFGLSALS